MNQNTYKHISDKSIYTWFDPTGTNFPNTIDNVQDALALTSPTKQATTTSVGVARIATQAEVDVGTNNSTIVTPLTLAARLSRPKATTTIAGVLMLATNAEALAGTVTDDAIVPSSLKYVFDTKLAKETTSGTIKLSSESAAKAGVEHTTAMTPLRVKQAIAEATASIPSYTPATESNAGLVTLATVGQAAAGVLRDGYAISPYTLMQLTANQTRKGVVQAATLAQANLGTDDSLYISAKGFKTYTASTTNVGTVKLSNSVLDTSNGVALSASAKVLKADSSTLQVADTKLNITGQLQSKGADVITESTIEDHMPIGSIIMWGGDTLPSDKYAICDGGLESVTNSPVLFARYGFKYGGNNVDMFARPDMRGLFVRGVGVSSHIQKEQGLDIKNKPKLGNDVSGGVVGEVQKQQVREHKHVVPWGETYGNSSYGQTASRGYVGSGKSDGNNPRFFTNEGYEVDKESSRGDYNTLNTVDAIGMETRPWNISMYYIIKVR